MLQLVEVVDVRAAHGSREAADLGLDPFFMIFQVFCSDMLVKRALYLSERPRLTFPVKHKRARTRKVFYGYKEKVKTDSERHGERLIEVIQKRVDGAVARLRHGDPHTLKTSSPPLFPLCSNSCSV